MRQAYHGHHAAATEVEPVELDFVRGVGQCERGDQGAQESRLPGLRAADDLHVAYRAGEVDPERVAALLERLVEKADRHDQTPRALVARLSESAALHRRETGQQGVQRRRAVQRRQPHLVGRRSLRLQPAHDHVQHGVRKGVVDLRIVRSRRPLLRHRHILHRHLGRREQHRPPVHRQRAAA